MKQFLSKHPAIKMAGRIYAFLFPLFLFLVLELMNPGIISPSFSFFGINLPNPFIRAPYADVMNRPAAILVSIVLIYLMILLLFALFGHVFAATVLVSVLLYILYTVSFYRKLLSGWVLAPADMLLSKQLGNILSFTHVPLDKHVLVSGFLLVLGLGLLWAASAGLSTGLRNRMLLFSGSLAVILCLFFTIPAQRVLFQLLDINYTTYKTSTNHIYRDQGVLLGFYVAANSGRADRIFQDEPVTTPAVDPQEPLLRIGASDFLERYSQSFMDDIINDIRSGLQGATITESPVEKPNIIVIMSEAWTDPMEWDNIVFSEDPAPVYRELIKTATHGKVLTPAFGGATCNPEYEFLTGGSLYFAGAGHTPFEMPDTYIPQKDLRAFPQILKRQGYTTIGVHPYLGEFFNRAEIYPRLGFDQFITIEDMPDAYNKGRFTADEYFTDKMIEVIESTDEPLFLYGISMENHYEYYGTKFGDQQDILCASPMLTEEQMRQADSYLQGVYDADAQLGRLIEYLKQSDKPTIVYFFGDHQPLLGGNAVDIFTSLQYISYHGIAEWTPEENYRMYRTPYVLWANYELPEHHWQDMSSFFIGPLLLDLAGLNQNLYFDFLRDAYHDFHGLRSTIYINQDETYYPTPIVEDQQVLDRFFYLNYDYIFGKGYSAAEQAAILPHSKAPR